MPIHLPLLMWYSLITGQPIVIYIAPGEAPVYSQPSTAPATTPAMTSEVDYGGCRWVVCKA